MKIRKCTWMMYNIKTIPKNMLRVLGDIVSRASEILIGILEDKKVH
jgi:hypothetical protein